MEELVSGTTLMLPETPMGAMVIGKMLSTDNLWKPPIGVAGREGHGWCRLAPQFCSLTAEPPSETRGRLQNSLHAGSHSECSGVCWLTQRMFWSLLAVRDTSFGPRNAAGSGTLSF